ncbi:hypothetical protein HPB51_012331 [Rhipicephalus microplus]|uniref:Uncharacterized protein n=1 Tax=Rhipicephalus microplus TaxID=6941 RepID=A0A9J6D9S2_RHIMP|nr:hypothetical protein HPB51_012331 [Rhipicephalus microplus]
MQPPQPGFDPATCGSSPEYLSHWTTAAGQTLETLLCVVCEASRVSPPCPRRTERVTDSEEVKRRLARNATCNHLVCFKRVERYGCENEKTRMRAHHVRRHGDAVSSE